MAISKKRKTTGKSEANYNLEKARESQSAIFEAFEEMSKTILPGFESEGSIPEINETKKIGTLPLYGFYGEQFYAATPSQELLEKEQQRIYGQEGAEDQISIIEQGLCAKYGIVPPTKWPNRRKDRGEGGEQLLIMGQTVDDRRHPRLWGIRQEDRTRHAYVVGGSGSGKRCVDSTPILTDKGWKNIGNITYQDRVYTRKGTLTNIIDISRGKHEQIWEIELADGQVIEAHAEHRWFVIRDCHGTRKEVVRTTQELYEEGVKTHKGKGNRNQIPLCKPVEFSEKLLPVPPYALGCLIGDGCLLDAHKNHLAFSCAEPDLLQLFSDDLGDHYELIKQVPNNPEDYGYHIHEIDIQEITLAPSLSKLILNLDLNKYSEDKFIPQEYLWASVEQRRELLKGLMDTDGCASQGRLCFATISTRLRDDFAYLCRSLGYQVRIRIDYRPDKYKHSNGKCWGVAILSNDIDNILKLPRKLGVFHTYRNNRKNIIEIYPKRKPTLFPHSKTNGITPLFSSSEIDDADTSYLAPYLAGIAAAHPSTRADLSLPEKNYKNFMGQRIQEYVPDVEISLVHPPSLSCGRFNFWAKGPLEINHRPCNRLLHQKRFSGLDLPRSKQNIPLHYKQASLLDRLTFLQGLFDSRGTITGKRLEIYIKTPQMIADLQELIESCGYTVEILDANKSGTKSVRIMNPDAGCVSDPDILETLAYSLQVPVAALFADLPDGIWHAPRFDDLFDEDGHLISENSLSDFDMTKRTNFNDGIAIVDIRPTERYADMTCISVADESESYLLENFIVTHNSTLLHALGVEDMWYWRGGLLMEPHGDLALGLLRTAPPYRIHDIVYLNVLDPLASPGFNPLELPMDATDEERAEATGTVTTLIAKHFHMADEAVQLRKMLTNSLNALSYVPGATLLEVMDFYTNEDIRNSILAWVPDGPQKDAMADLAMNAKSDQLGSLENRISRFTTNRFMKHLFGQSHTTLNFFDLMNQGCYIICPVSKGGTSDDTFLKFYGSYIVSEVYKAALMRDTIEEGDRVNFALTLDEFQNFISDDIEGILAEARKYGLMMMLANQYLDQLTPTIKAAVLQNCATKLVYNLGPRDAPEFAKAFGYGIKAEDLQSIPKYHVMAAPLIRGGNVRPFISAVFPPISLKSEVAAITADLIAENSRNKFMKPRDEIDAEIRDRKERLASGNKDAIAELVMKKNR